MICATSRVTSDPSLFANCHIFSDSSLTWSVKYFIHGSKSFITHHSVIQRRSQPDYSAHAACYSPTQELCLHVGYVGPLDWTLPAPGITIHVTYPAAEMT